jgi:hypothetical protein
VNFTLPNFDPSQVQGSGLGALDQPGYERFKPAIDRLQAAPDLLGGIHQDDGPDIDKDLPPHFHALLDQWNGYKDRDQTLSDYFGADGKYSGLSRDQIRNVQQDEQIHAAIQPIVMEAAKLDDHESNAWEAAFMKELQNAPRPPGYRLDKPTILQAALTAFSAILQPRYAADSAAGTLAGNKAFADQRYQQDWQQFGAVQDEHNRRLSYLGHMADQASEDERAKFSADQRTNEVNATQANENQRLSAQLSGNQQAKHDQELATRTQKAWDAYNKQPSEVNAARLRVLDPEFAPTLEQVQADTQRVGAKNKLEAQAEWRKILDSHADIWGDISDDDAKTLSAQKESFANAFGLDPAQLEEPMSGTTRKAQFAKDKRTEFDAHLKYLEDKQKDDLAVKWAEEQNAEGRLAVAQQNAQTYGGILTDRQYNSSLRAYQLAQKGTAGAAEKALQSYETKLAGARNTLVQLQQARAQETDSKRLADLDKRIRDTQDDIHKLAGERDYLKSQMPAESPAAPPPGLVNPFSGTIGAGGKDIQVDVPLSPDQQRVLRDTKQAAQDAVRAPRPQKKKKSQKQAGDAFDYHGSKIRVSN